MCGIVGCAGDGAVEARELRRMADRIAHRGPDDSGVEVWPEHGLGLGHRRLSILDLSALGRQPMCNEDGTVWITFNGEVYNFRALRRELEELGHTFRSGTDTEVVLHAYEEWGDEHVHRLRGMFAYALYDRREGVGPRGYRLLLVRDRLGIKPLFYSLKDGLLVFASEIKAVLEHPRVDRRTDRSALFDYLTYLYVPAPKTAHLHVRKLRPGHLLSFDSEAVRIRRYWDVPLRDGASRPSWGEALERVRAGVDEAVQAHTVADVPVGVFLSGGIDSGAVTALLARSCTERTRTFSIGFDVAQHSETQYAALVADRYGTAHHESIVGVESVREMLPRVLSMYDEPYADGSAVPTFRVSSLAGEHVKVVLSGDGGDEVFAGYRWYSVWLQRSAADRVPFRRGISRSLASVWPEGWRGHQFLLDAAMLPLERYGRLMELFTPAEKRRLLGDDWVREFEGYDDYWYFREHWREDLEPLQRMQYLDLKTYLPDDILTKVDRASMAVSLEVRPPFLDHRLVEDLFPVMAGFPAGERCDKRMLRSAVSDLLPHEVLHRPKKGFSAPWTSWMHTEREWVEGELRAGARRLGLRETAVGDPALFRNGARLWAVLLLQGWMSEQ